MKNYCCRRGGGFIITLVVAILFCCRQQQQTSIIIIPPLLVSASLSSFVVGVSTSSAPPFLFSSTRIRRRRRRAALFQPPLLLWATTEEQQNNNHDPTVRNKKKQTTTRKPSRFTQVVHNQHKTDSTTTTNPLPTTNKSQKKKKQQTSNSTIKEKTTTTTTFDKDRMWKTSKSIEELENSLTDRYGTDLSQWTAHDKYDDENDEHDDDNDQPSIPVFQARPVMDPWNINMDDNDRDKNENYSRRPSESSSSSSSRSSSSRSRSSSPLSAFGGGVSSQSSSLNKKEEIIMDLSHLISGQKPVGGQGTFSVQDDKKKKTNQKTIMTTETTTSTTTKIKKNKNKISTTKPILDDDGNPQFLTTIQAEHIFQQKSSTDKHSEDDDDEAEQKESTTTEAISWQELGITDTILLENLEYMDCGNPLAVQRNSCRHILSKSEDVVIGTYTGSGKTCAFLVPIIQQLLRHDDNDTPSSSSSGSGGGPRILIVAPGRELASQIVSVARDLLNGTGRTAMLAIGGTTFTRNLEQIRKRKPNILVGTPGRIAELVVGRNGERRGRLNLKNLETIVLDEFDALLEYRPHRDPTHAIMDTLKRVRGSDRLQSILCSATASDMLASKNNNKLSQYLRSDYTVTLAEKDDQLVTEGSTATTTRVSRTVIHGVVHVPHRRFALETLRRVLHAEPLPQQILVFVSDSRKVNIVVEKLEQNMGIIAAPLHGGSGSEKMDRAEVSKALREGYVGIVVATELAARGLDAPLLTHVINMDLPTDASHYAHRAGRCGRGGRPGVVINFTTNPKERKVPQKFADKLGIDMHTVDIRNSKLNIVDPESLNLDSL